MAPQKSTLSPFFTHIGQWSWVYTIYRFKKNHMVIADEDFGEFVTTRIKDELMCRMETPDVDLDDLGDIEKVLVFLKRGELGMVKALKARYPNMLVCSGSYEFGLVGLDRVPRLRDFHVPEPADSAKLNLIISTPYAGAEYIAAALFNAGLPRFHEYLGRPFATMMERTEDFQPFRFLCHAQSHFGKKAPLYGILQSDVLISAFENTSLSFSRFRRFLEDGQVRILVVKKRNCREQAVHWQLMDRSPERSVWTKPPAKGLPVRYLETDLVPCMRKMEQLEEHDALIDEIAGFASPVQQIYWEDLMENPSDGLTSVANFFGLDYEEAKDLPSRSFEEMKAPHLSVAPRDFIHELIDRIGTHAALPL